jgi:hypothetical protein
VRLELRLDDAEAPMLIQAARELGISVDINPDSGAAADRTFAFPSDPDVRHLSQLSEPRPRYKRRRRPILPRRREPRIEPRPYATVPELELPTGQVSTPTLQRHMQLRDETISPATLSRLKAAGHITPHPHLRVATPIGRPAEVWDLDATLAAIAAHKAA